MAWMISFESSLDADVHCENNSYIFFTFCYTSKKNNDKEVISINKS